MHPNQVNLDFDSTPAVETDVFLTSGPVKINGPEYVGGAGEYIWNTYKVPVGAPPNYILVSDIQTWNGSSYDTNVNGLYIDSGGYHIVLIDDDTSEPGWIMAHETGRMLGEGHYDWFGNLMHSISNFGGDNLTDTQKSGMWSNAINRSN